jgi:hypothetical protein
VPFSTKKTIKKNLVEFLVRNKIDKNAKTIGNEIWTWKEIGTAHSFLPSGTFWRKRNRRYCHSNIGFQRIVLLQVKSLSFPL